MATTVRRIREAAVLNTTLNDMVDRVLFTTVQALFSAMMHAAKLYNWETSGEGAAVPDNARGRRHRRRAKPHGSRSNRAL